MNLNRIIYLSNSIFPSTAANSVHVMKMCQAMAALVDDVELVARHYSQKPNISQLFQQYGVKQNFKLHLMQSINIRGSSFFLIPSLYIYLLRKERSGTLVYARDPIGAFVALKLGYLVYFESHALPSSRYLIWLESRFFKHKNFRKLILISKALKNLYSEFFNKLPNYTYIFHDAADMPSEHLKNEGLIKHKSRERLKVGYVGHLYKGRGIDIIIKLARLVPEHEFHIFGGTPKSLAYWRRRSKCNTFFHGHIDPVETPIARKNCDILLMPYQQDLETSERGPNTSSWMSPLKLFEYMSAQRPIISSDLPVLREVLSNKNAILVPPDSVQAWVEAIRTLEDAEIREKLAGQAFKDFVEKYTWSARAKGILDIR